MPTRPNPDDVVWETKPSPENIEWDVSPPPERGFGERWIEEILAPRNILGATGGIGGAAIGGPLLGVAGAFGGGVLGEFIEQKLQQGQAPTVGERIPGLDEEEQEDAWAMLQELGMAGLEQAAYEATGHGVMRGAGRLANIARRRLIGPMLKEAKGVTRAFGRRMKPLFPVLPAEATPGKLLDIAHNVAEKGFFAGRIQIYKTARDKAINEVIDGVANEVGRIASPDEIGTMFQRVVTGHIHAREAATAPLWSAIDDVMAGARVNIKDVNEIFAPYQKVVEEIGADLHPQFKRMISRALKRPDEIGWMSAREFKSDLARSIRLMTREVGKDDKMVRMLYKMQNAIQGAMRKTTEEIGGTAPDLWKQVNTIYAEKSRPINRRFIVKLLNEIEKKQAPEIITRRVFTKGNINNIRSIKNVLGDTSDEWLNLKRWHIQDVIEGARNPRTDSFIGAQFKKRFENIIRISGQTTG
jgi:hypothetical protein